MSKKKSEPRVKRPRAALKLKVNVTDKQVAQLLTAKFGSAEAIQNILVDKLNEIAKPMLQKVNELEQRFIAEREKLLKQV